MGGWGSEGLSWPSRVSPCKFDRPGDDPSTPPRYTRVKVWDMLANASPSDLQSPAPLLSVAIAWLQAGLCVKEPDTSANAAKRRKRRGLSQTRDASRWVGESSLRPPARPDGPWRRPGRASRSRRAWQMERSAEQAAPPSRTERSARPSKTQAVGGGGGGIVFGDIYT